MVSNEERGDANWRTTQSGAEARRGTGKVQCGLLPLLAAALLGLAGLPAKVLAQQALVSNLGQADFANPSLIASLFGGLDHAQQFTTGGNSAGYRLNSVEIEFNRLDAGVPFTVSIRANASGAPGTVVGTLRNPAYTAFTSDTVLTFTAAGSGIALAANTSYFLVLDVTGDIGSNFASWRVTTSMNEDSGAASGWSIANLHRFRWNTDGAQWTNNLVRSSLKIRINGAAVTLPTVTIAGVASPVTEGAAARFTISRTGATTAALAVSLTVADASGSDFVATGNEGADTVTIAAGQASVAYSVATVADNTNEANGDVTVTLTAGTGYTLGTSSAATVTVADDDTPEVLIVESDGGTSVGENGGGDTYTVRLATEPGHNVTITVSSATDSAATVNKAAGSAGKTQTLTFTPSGAGAWNVAQTITVTGVNNSRDDVGNQRSSVITHTAASSDTDYNGISIGSVTVTVTDDDTPVLTVAAQGATTRIDEGATATIIVTSDIPVDGSINHGQPTVSARGSVSASATTISGGGSSNSYTVTATGNNLDEPDWSLTTRIAAGSGYTLGAPGSVVLAVRDDDPTIVSLAGGGSLFEGETAVFTVTLGRALVAGEIIDVPLAVSGANVTVGDWNLALQSGAGLNEGVALSGAATATPQLRFDGTGARLATLALTAAAGSGGKTLRVELGPDGAGINGFDRTSLGSNVGGGADPHATARGFNLVVTANTVINERDFIVFSPARSEVSGQTLPEGAQRTFSVHRIAYKPDGTGLHLPNAWGFRLCFTGTATPGADYQLWHNGRLVRLNQDGCTRTNNAADGTARTAGSSRARFNITILPDDLDELEESVIVTLSQTVNSGVSSEGLSETRFTIAEAPLIDKVRHYTTELAQGWGHVLRWRRVLHALSGGTEGEGPAMTAAEAQGYADQGWARWVPVVVALAAREGATQQAQQAPAENQDDVAAAAEAEAEAKTEVEAETEVETETEVAAEADPYADLIAAVRGYALETDEGPEHVRRWQRVLKALGETDVAFVELEPMTTAEAQGYAGRGWSRWDPVAAALAAREGGAAQQATPSPAPASTEPTVSVDDAEVREGHAAAFTVRLSAPAPVLIYVFAKTRESMPVSAEEGVDYRAKSAAAVFRKGDVEQQILVATINDAHDDSGETFELVLTRVSDGAALADAVGVGMITNDDPLPAAHLARFGRTVAEHALGGIAGRLAAPRTPGLRGVFAGRAFSAAAVKPVSGGVAPLTIGATNGPDGFHTPGGGVGVKPLLGRSTLAGDSHSAAAHSLDVRLLDARLLDSRPPGDGTSMTARAALLGSSFTLTRAADRAAGSLAFWGRAAQSHFDGVDRGHGTDVTLNGKVTTVMLGADYARGDWLVGLTLTETAAAGGYRAAAGNLCKDEVVAVGDTTGSTSELCATADPDTAVGAGAGEVKSALTAVVPYATRRVAERLTLWGATGYGRGAVTLMPGAAATLTADTDWVLAAAGLRGDLLAPVGPGPVLALTSDALWTRTTSAATRGLLASASAVTRLRLGLEGSWVLDFAGTRRVTPNLAVGARHDGGDAETGFGVEFGGGVQWLEPRLGLTLDISARTLLTHEDGDLKDRGISAVLTFDPAPGTPFGPRLSLRHDLGGPAYGGLDALFRPETLQSRRGTHAAARWTLEAAYGLPALKGRFSSHPLAGVGRAAGVQDYHLGWQLAPAAAHAPDFSLSMRAVRRMRVQAEAEHGFELRFNWQW